MHGCRFSLGVLTVLLLAAFATAEPGRRQKKSTTTAAPVKVVYSVADLVVPVEDFVPPMAADLDNDFDQIPDEPPGLKLFNGIASKKKRTVDDKLIRLIQTTVAPNSWQDVGGIGAIAYEPVKMSLVVTQSAAVQEEIGDLLAALRRLQEVEVSVGLHVLKVSDDTLNRLPVALDRIKAEDPPILTPDQVKQVLAIAESEKRSDVMQSPRITVFNGQLACITLLDMQPYLDDVHVEKKAGKFTIVPTYKQVRTGMTFSVQPVASADRESVRTSIKFRLAVPESLKRETASLLVKNVVLPGLAPTGCASPSEEPRVASDKEITLLCAVEKPKVTLLKVDRPTLTIPGGQTVLMYAGTATEEFREENALTDIPFLSHYFKTVAEGRHTRHVLVLLTAHIIVESADRAKKCAKTPELLQRVYSVADLVVPLECDLQLAENGERKTRDEELIDTIRTMIAPESWGDNGGDGELQYYPLGMGLVVRQTPAVHEKIASLLEKLRQDRLETGTSEPASADEGNALSVLLEVIQDAIDMTGFSNALEWLQEGTDEHFCAPFDPETAAIMPPIPKGKKPLCENPPDRREILRAMPRPNRGISHVYEEFRDNLDIQIEKLVDAVDPVRFYPLVGPAQLHHCHWKCTVSFDETIEASLPFPWQCTRRRTEVVYIDKDHLHLAAAAKDEQSTMPSAHRS